VEWANGAWRGRLNDRHGRDRWRRAWAGVIEPGVGQWANGGRQSDKLGRQVVMVVNRNEQLFATLVRWNRIEPGIELLMMMGERAGVSGHQWA